MSPPAGFKPIEFTPSGTYVDLWSAELGVQPRCLLWIEQWHVIGLDGVVGERVTPEPTHWRETLEDATPSSATVQ